LLGVGWFVVHVCGNKINTLVKQQQHMAAMNDDGVCALVEIVTVTIKPPVVSI